MREAQFQRHVIDRLNDEFPGCYIIKTDPGYIQGFPDLLVLYDKFWAALEVKVGSGAHHQPNQEYYIYKLSDMGYAAFIMPENEEDVFSGLRDWFSCDE